MLILLNKPFRVLCQFRDREGRATLADFVDTPDVYPAGRLDYDSEGLTLLTDDGKLQARISQPRSRIRKTYWAQVEGTPMERQLNELLRGVTLKDGIAKAVSIRQIEQPAGIWDRDPPIRHRANVADSWLEITVTAGRNRMIRRMTAAAGLPTLRLIRVSVGPWDLDDLQPGQSRIIDSKLAWSAL